MKCTENLLRGETQVFFPIVFLCLSLEGDLKFFLQVYEKLILHEGVSCGLNSELPGASHHKTVNPEELDSFTCVCFP